MSNASSKGAQPQSILQSNVSASLDSLTAQFTGAGSTGSSIVQQASSSASDDSQSTLQQASELHLGSTDTDHTTVTWEDKGGQGHSDSEHTQQQDSMDLARTDGEVMLEQVNPQIELVEHIPDASTTGGQVEEVHEWDSDHDNHELKRVKVYELVGSRWVDQGTAFCFGQFDADTGDALLIARAERDYNEVILSTTIRSSDVYQRQQDTLIVWTEPDGVDYALSFQDPEGCAEVWNFISEVQRHMNTTDESGLASSPVLGSETTSVTIANIIRSGHLPQPQFGIISDIERAIKTIARTQTLKERICEYIQHEEYVKSLIEVMRNAEDLESLENLHAICSLMQTILMLNDHNLYEHIVEDDLFVGVAGILEYDPEFPNHKANYREFLENASTFHQPIPINDLNIRRKIHHTYRLQFLKDVILARTLDDSTFNVLNSCIIFNQIDIINHVQQEPSFLREIVKLFVDEEVLNGGKRPIPQQRNPAQQPMVISLNGAGDNVTKSDDPSAMDVDSPQPPSSPKLNGSLASHTDNSPPRKQTYALAPPEDLSEEEINRRREVTILIQQLCAMGKNVQLPARMALFRTLVDRGILFAVQWAMNLPEKEDINKPLIAAAGEILSALLDHDLNGVRGHVLKQVMAIEREREAGKKGADKAETILEMACRMMAHSMDLSVQTQVGDALKVWLDLPTPDATGAGAGPSEANHSLIPKTIGRKDDPGTERFMDYFYKQCIHALFKPFMDLPEWRHVTEPVFSLTREQTNRYVYCCDLLYNFIQQHHFRSHFFIMSTNVMVRIAALLKAKDKHLRHASFRIFRLVLKLNNANLHMQIMKNDVLKPILDLTLAESRRDNLLSCSCQEYFESMRKENMKDLIKFCMTKHEEDIRKLAETPLGGERFKLFISRYEMNIAPPPMDEGKPEQTPEKRGWPDSSRALDAEEEDYFNTDDDDDTNIPSISQTSTTWVPIRTPLSFANSKIKQRRGSTSASVSPSKPLRSSLKPQPPLSSLLDYGEDEDEEIGPQPAPSSSIPPTSPAASAPTPPPGSPSPEIPSSSPKLAHRQALKATDGNSPGSNDPTSMAVSEEEEDEEDLLLESLVRAKNAGMTNGEVEMTGRPSTPGPGMMASMESIGPMRPSEKRRRDDEDEDDELMARLTKVKKSDHVSPQKNPAPVAGTSSGSSNGSLTSRTTKNGDDAPKFKVKFGSSLGIKGFPSTQQPKQANNSGLTSTTPKVEESPDSMTEEMTTPCSTPADSSEPSVKDGDTG